MSTHARVAAKASLLASTMILSACASMSALDPGLRPFTTDGCSLFPDRSYISHADWCSCCVAHDIAYWRGGTQEQRLAADQALRDCVKKSTNNPLLANLMFEGVRLGGGPYFFTSYRWGYGWQAGRAYTPLSKDEQFEADRLEAEYRRTNPELKCDIKSDPANANTSC